MPNTNNDCPGARIESDGEHVEVLPTEEKKSLACDHARGARLVSSDASAAMGISQSAASRLIRSLKIELQVCAVHEAWPRRGAHVRRRDPAFPREAGAEQLRHAAERFGRDPRGGCVRRHDARQRSRISRIHCGLQSRNGVAGRAFPRRQTALDQPVAVKTSSCASSRRCSSGEAFQFRAKPIGEKLIVCFKCMFRELDQAHEEIRLNLGNRKGQVVLGCLPPTPTRLVLDAIGAITAEYPDVNVRVVDGIFQTFFAMLMHGELDILIGTLRDPLPEGTNSEFLLFDKVSIVARPEHPLARRDVVTLEDCLRYDWILPSSAAPLTHFFKNKGPAKPRICVSRSVH